MKNITTLLTELEGFRNTVYKDSAGLPTIGIGHLLTKDELNSGKIHIGDRTIKYGGGLTDEQVRLLFADDIYKFKRALITLVNVELTDNQEVALLSFMFNIGIVAFKNSTLLKRLNNGDYDAVPFEMMRWVYSGGEYIKGLENRRKKEIEVWNA